MRKRDRMRTRFVSLFTSDTIPSAPRKKADTTTSASSPGVSLPPASSTDPSVATTSHSLVLERALAKAKENIPQDEQVAFAQASKTIDERSLLSGVQAYDAAHKDDSSFRPYAERLSKFLSLLDRFMGGVAIGTQASPDMSALVVGSVRVVIGLALKFTMYFSRLSDMICTFEDYLGPLAEYAKAADITLVETTVANAYANMLSFGWKARRVFIDANGDVRKWTCLRAFIRQHWETFESEFATIREDLDHHLDVLLHSVSSLHFDFARKTEQARRHDEDRKERSAFLTWLSSIDFEKTHQDTFAKKHERTCHWLIQEPKYQQWSTSPASSLLWCHGKPGIGKSVLASNVIEDITTKIGLREDAALCFAYYNYRDTQLKDLHQIVNALLKQLCRRKAYLPRDLLENKNNALPPSLMGTQERFRSLIEDLAQVYVVFDAIDECPEQERGEILGFITDIVTAPIRCHVKVFVTSRNEMDIAKAFGDRRVPTIQIQTKNVTADIETFVRSRVEKLQAGEHGKTLYITSADLKENIVLMLAQKAEGMFLWVNLQLDSLCQASKARQDAVVEAALATIPQGLPDTYVRILERIEAQTPYMRELAFACLAWTLYARRPLSTGELHLALSIHSNCKVIEDMQTDSSRVILEACGNLLEETNHSIRPIHYTVQEFLTSAVPEVSHGIIRAQLLDSKAVHTRLSLACIAYIRSTAFVQPAPSPRELLRQFRRNGFARYAYQSFDYHILKCEELSLNVTDELESLLRQESACLAAILQIKVLRDEDHRIIEDRFNHMGFLVTPGTIVYSTALYNIPALRQKWVEKAPPTYALHLTASAGLTSAFNRLLEAGCEINEKDSNHCTPLYYACLDGNVHIAEVLINMQADVNVQGGFLGNPLQVASSRGYEQLVRMLLAAGAGVNAQGGHYGNALQAASVHGHKQVVKMLLDKGAKVNARVGWYGNALQAASIQGHAQVVKTLANGGADVNMNVPGLRHQLAKDYCEDNALRAASARGHEEVVKILLDNGANVNAQGGEYGNALQAASIRGHAQVVKILANSGADVNMNVPQLRHPLAKDYYEDNALRAASAGGHEEVVKILLDRGVNVDHDNALQAASARGYVHIVELLLDKGANLNCNKALQAASVNGYLRVVNLLLDKGADLNCNKALQEASADGYVHVVELLLDKGTDLDYNKALQAASARGYVHIVELLLNEGADLDYNKALQAASARGYVHIVELLLNKGANLNYNKALQAASARDYWRVVNLLLDRCTDLDYNKALQAASARDYWEVVELLLRKGADLDYNKALQAASARGYSQVVKLLLDSGAEFDYDKALQAASGGGHERVVKLLLDAGAHQSKEDDTVSKSE